LPLPIVQRSQEETERIIKRNVERVGHVKSCDRVVVRMSGKRSEVGMDVSLDSKMSSVDLHRVVSSVERAVKAVIPNARVAVRTEALGGGKEELWRLVKEVAEKVPGTRGVHSIHLQRAGGKILVDFHLEVSANLTVKQAHAISEQVEKELRAANPNIGDIVIHMESASDLVDREQTGAGTALKWFVEDLVARFPEVKGINEISIRRIGEKLHVETRISFDPDISVKQAHEVAYQVETAIRNAYPNIARVDIHQEPA